MCSTKRAVARESDAVYSRAHGPCRCSRATGLLDARARRREPRRLSPARIRDGRCSASSAPSCHGADGRGLNGPNLTNLFTIAAAVTIASLQIIRNGVPGSIMPASRNTDDEIRAIVGYLKVLATPPPSSAAYLRAESQRRSRHADDQRWPRDPWRAKERRRVLDPDPRERRPAAGLSSSRRCRTSRAANAAPAAKVDPPPGVTYRDILERPEGSVALAHVLRRLHRPAPQPAHADQSGQRRRPQARVDIPDRHDDARPRVRGDAACSGTTCST